MRRLLCWLRGGHRDAAYLEKIEVEIVGGGLLTRVSEKCVRCGRVKR